jgi:hypothetical protein
LGASREGPSDLREEEVDLKYFFQRLRQVSSEIESEFVVIISLETPDGGKAGVCTEVSRINGARAVVEARARIATNEEEAEFRRQVKSQMDAAVADVTRMHYLVQSVTPVAHSVEMKS